MKMRMMQVKSIDGHESKLSTGQSYIYFLLGSNAEGSTDTRKPPVCETMNGEDSSISGRGLISSCGRRTTQNKLWIL